MADFDWDLDKYYWPRERVLRWWDQGWDWESLEGKKCNYSYYESYYDYYKETYESLSITFSDPNQTGFPSQQERKETPSISEKAYWGERWLTEFPAGSGKFWDPYHLPLFDPMTGDLSPKHQNCNEFVKWSLKDLDAFRRGLVARMFRGRNNINDTGEDANASLSGIVVPPMTFFDTLADKKIFVDFSESLFADGILFGSVCFGEQSNLSKSYFGEPRMFSRATFARAVNLSQSVFADGFDFLSAKFGSKVDFSQTTFLGTVSFARGDHQEDGSRAGLIEADPEDKKYTLHLDKQRDAREETAFQDISFEGAEFWGDADFSGRHFAGKTDFFGAKFHKIPIFHRATFAQDPRWSVDVSFSPAPGRKPDRTIVAVPKKRWLKPVAGGAQKINGVWTNLQRDDWAGMDKNARTKRCTDFEQAYRRLKILMLDMGARTAEHFFYTLEVKSRIKRHNVSKFEKVLAYFYWWVSDFGQSLWRPFLLFFAAHGAAALSLCGLSYLAGYDGFSPAVRHDALLYVGRNFVPGAWLHDLSDTAVSQASEYQIWINALLDKCGGGFFTVAAMHEILTLALLFLFGLALKRRFQIK